MTTDKFVPAIEELGSALGAGEKLETALVEIADDYGLAPQALRNRAERSLGDLAAYAVQRAASDKHERQWAMARRHVIARAAERGETMSVEDADAEIRFWGIEGVMRPAPEGFTPTKATWDDE
ncbi:hypothetical protein ABID82_007140 [Methylobacterium sp. PvP062]|uniref:Uncharacterized protein n=1 Tax=Methylobacterium radiotolerans TaxID=31998 RepID=A0ABV2NTV8_9HYPH|nr:MULTISPECIES: hypothetical protein [unclassified Methylobacterium]MBP2498337.1 hypothetical protein [Methylobacterium sp. PvP105]MBP2505721.1 hypothetical protein [Methylobacterium sp. PvP109]